MRSGWRRRISSGRSRRRAVRCSAVVREGVRQPWAVRALGAVGDGRGADELGEPAGGGEVVDVEGLEHAGIGEEGGGLAAVEGLELAEVLEDGPELEAVAGHQAHGALDDGEMAEGGELVEQEQDRGRRDGGIAGDLLDGLGEEEAQPAAVGVEAIGRQDEEDRDELVLELGETKIRAHEQLAQARAVQEMRMPLGARRARPRPRARTWRDGGWRRGRRGRGLRSSAA